jgi:glycerophosphoryl diester phosphodiesterase
MVAVVIIILIIALLLVLALSGRVEDKRFRAYRGKPVAHRGLYKNPEIPENSIPAFALAVKQGYGIELDVHLLSDGTLAVFHDDTLLRMTGKDGRIRDLAGEELKNYTLDGTNYSIPTFDEVLSVVDGKVPLIIELKTENNAAELCKAVVRKLKEYSGDYVIESFDPRALMWLRKNYPGITRGQLAQDFVKKSENLNIPLRLILSALLLNFLTKPDFVAYKFSDRKNIFNLICTKFWKIQPVYWTIENREEYEMAKAEGAISIFEGFLPDQLGE